MTFSWKPAERRIPALIRITAAGLVGLFVLTSAAIPQTLSLKFCGTTAAEEEGSTKSHLVGQGSDLPSRDTEPVAAGLSFCSSAPDAGNFLTFNDAIPAMSGCSGTWINNTCKGFPRNC